MTCVSTRAVHIEIVPSLDTDSFLMAFWRFSNRRGRPSDCWSDNATYFTASDKELADAIENWNHSKIANELNQHKITWHFSPPSMARMACTKNLRGDAMVNECVLKREPCYLQNLNFTVVGEQNLFIKLIPEEKNVTPRRRSNQTFELPPTLKQASHLQYVCDALAQQDNEIARTLAERTSAFL